MNQLKLIANDESAEDLCALIERLHTEMVEMRAEMQRGFDVLLAVKTDDTETLRKMIVSAPPAVVPFEDETAPVVEPLPVLASCPCCENKEAHTEAQVEELFGYRTMEDGKVRVQSWCRECRGLEGKTNPRKKQRLPDDVRELGQKARRLLAEASKLEAKRKTLLQATSGRETKQTIELSAEIAAKRTASLPLMAQYEAARSIIRKAKGTK